MHITRTVRLSAFLLGGSLIASHCSTNLDAGGKAARDGSAGAPKYLVHDLGRVERIASDVMPALNSLGDVVIWRQSISQSFQPVLCTGGAEEALGVPAGYRNGFAYSLNDQRKAAGWANTTLNPIDSLSVTHAVLFSNHQTVDLGTLGGVRSRAYAINDHDLIVGVSELANSEQRAFRFSGGKMTELNRLPGARFSIALAVNESGVIVGASESKSTGARKPLVHAVIWRGSVPQDLGELIPDGNSSAYAVNNHEAVVGVADSPAGETVFLYTGRRMTDLVIKGHAFSVNDSLQVVGTRAGSERSRSSAFLWDRGRVYDLDRCVLASGNVQIEGAYRINNAGQIACVGLIAGERHALLLTPAT
jgi:probable HAF family extracellular repeat protein